MKLQRITLDPLARIERPTDPERDGRRCVWDTDTHGPVPDGYLPAGEAYVPIVERPDYDAATQRIERTLTLDADGWSVINLTDEEIRARTVPAEVSRRQLLLVLASLDTPITKDAIRASLAGNALGLIEFDEAQSFRRDHPLVAALAAQLGMDDATVDQLFISASQL